MTDEDARDQGPRVPLEIWRQGELLGLIPPPAPQAPGNRNTTAEQVASQIIRTRDATIADLMQTIAVKNQLIDRLSDQVTDLKAHVDELTATRASFSNIIAERDKMITDLQMLNRQQGDQIAEHTDRRFQLGQTIGARDAEIAKLKDNLAHTHQAVDARNAEITKLNALINHLRTNTAAEKTARIRELEQRLEGIIEAAMGGRLTLDEATRPAELRQARPDGHDPEFLEFDKALEEFKRR